MAEVQLLLDDESGRKCFLMEIGAKDTPAEESASIGAVREHGQFVRRGHDEGRGIVVEGLVDAVAV